MARNDRYGAPQHDPRCQGAAHSPTPHVNRAAGEYRGAHATRPQQQSYEGAPYGRIPLQRPARHAGSYSAMHDSALIAERRHKRKRLRVLRIVVIAVLAVLLSAGVAFGAYSTMLNSRLAIDDSSERDAINDALVEADLNEPFYMLVLGSDSREGSGTSSRADESGDNQRSDVMILMRVDAPNHQVTMVSIPRDTPLHWEDGSIIKMNEAYNYGGAAATIKAVSQLTGVPIAHYAEIHFSELQQLVDRLGGVTVDVPIELSYEDALTGEWITLEPGEQTLDGQQAQIFARARHEYSGNQDAQRQSSVRQLAIAIVEKVLDRPFYELPGTILDTADVVGTDLETGDIIALASAFASGSGDITMYSGTGPTDGDINPAANDLWFCYESPEGWEKLMAVVEAGEDPSAVDYSDVESYPAVP